MNNNGTFIRIEFSVYTLEMIMQLKKIVLDRDCEQPMSHTKKLR